MLLVKLVAVLTILSCTLSSNLWALGEKQQFGPTELWDHPWMADITIECTKGNRKITYHCVGALVHERAVLTGGKCIDRTDPFSNNTKIFIHGDVLNDSGNATEERTYAMMNVTYHNFEAKYDPKKLDYGLVLLYDKIIYNSSNNNKQGKVISIASRTDIRDVDFNDCNLTSISIRLRTKTQIKFACNLQDSASVLIKCKPKTDELVGYDSGSPVTCKRISSRDPVLVGFMNKHYRIEVNGTYELVQQYTSMVQLGHNLTYNVIDSVMDKEYPPLK